MIDLLDSYIIINHATIFKNNFQGPNFVGVMTNLGKAVAKAVYGEGKQKQK